MPMQSCLLSVLVVEQKIFAYIKSIVRRCRPQRVLGEQDRCIYLRLLRLCDYGNGIGKGEKGFNLVLIRR